MGMLDLLVRRAYLAKTVRRVNLVPRVNLAWMVLASTYGLVSIASLAVAKTYLICRCSLTQLRVRRTL
jgi:hypothetical protein